jgi:hypothetical protein
MRRYSRKRPVKSCFVTTGVFLHVADASTDHVCLTCLKEFQPGEQIVVEIGKWRGVYRPENGAESTREYHVLCTEERLLKKLATTVEAEEEACILDNVRFECETLDGAFI